MSILTIFLLCLINDESLSYRYRVQNILGYGLVLKCFSNNEIIIYYSYNRVNYLKINLFIESIVLTIIIEIVTF